MGNGISKELMAEFKEVIKGKFDEKEITHMYRLFHKAAPTGKMGPQEFKKYIEQHTFLSYFLQGERERSVMEVRELRRDSTAISRGRSVCGT